MFKDLLAATCVFVAGFIVGVCFLEIYNDNMIDEIAEEVLQRSRNQERLRIVDKYCHDVLTRGR